jgi:hypothetical protein
MIKFLIVLALLLGLSAIGFGGVTTRSFAFTPSQPLDDQFGMSFDSGYSSRTNWVPPGTQGLQIRFSVNTPDVDCLNSAGSVAPVLTARIKSGAQYEALLQASVTLLCTGNGASEWTFGYEYFDNQNNYHDKTIGTLSTSSYSSLTGAISIYYYSGCSCWVDDTYVDQNNANYIYLYPSTIQGTYVDGNNNDWSNVETDASQVGIFFYFGFSWPLTDPAFYIGGYFQHYNYFGGGSNFYMEAYADFSPVTPSSNYLAVVQSGSGYGGGVNIYWYGPNPPNNNGNHISWLVFHCCIGSGSSLIFNGSSP